MKLSAAWSKLKSPDFLAKLKADDILNMSSSLAFYGMLSLAPLLILTLTIYSILGENSRELLINQVKILAGDQAAAALRSISLSAQANINLRDTAGLIGAGSLLLSSGAIFGHLRSAFNKIFEVTSPTDKPGVPLTKKVAAAVTGKLFNLFMVLLFVFIALISVLISSVISLLLHGQQVFWGHLANTLVSFIVFGLIFSALYYFLPQTRIPRRVAVLSGLLTGVLFTAGKALIGSFIGNMAMGSAFGAAGSLLAILVWIYYSSIVVFLCAEVSHHILDKPTR